MVVGGVQYGWSCVTHLIEDDWDPRFVQEQVDHERVNIPSLYTCVSLDFRTRTLRRHLDSTIAAALQVRTGRQARSARLATRGGCAGS